MDKQLTVHQKKGSTKQQAKTKKKPLKVVYITNPMKVKTSASEFRALVQELTGQDADPTRFLDTAGYVGGCLDNSNEVKMVEDQAVNVVPTMKIGGKYPKQSSDVSFQYDEIFMQPMEEGFQGFLPSSSIWYESAHVDVLKSLDAM